MIPNNKMIDQNWNFRSQVQQYKQNTIQNIEKKNNIKYVENKIISKILSNTNFYKPTNKQITRQNKSQTSVRNIRGNQIVQSIQNPKHEINALIEQPQNMFIPFVQERDHMNRLIKPRYQTQVQTQEYDEDLEEEQENMNKKDKKTEKKMKKYKKQDKIKEDISKSKTNSQFQSPKNANLNVFTPQNYSGNNTNTHKKNNQEDQYIEEINNLFENSYLSQNNQSNNNNNNNNHQTSIKEQKYQSNTDRVNKDDIFDSPGSESLYIEFLQKQQKSQQELKERKHSFENLMDNFDISSKNDEKSNKNQDKKENTKENTNNINNNNQDFKNQYEYYQNNIASKYNRQSKSEEKSRKQMFQNKQKQRKKEASKNKSTSNFHNFFQISQQNLHFQSENLSPSAAALLQTQPQLNQLNFFEQKKLNQEQYKQQSTQIQQKLNNQIFPKSPSTHKKYPWMTEKQHQNIQKMQGVKRQFTPYSNPSTAFSIQRQKSSKRKNNPSVIESGKLYKQYSQMISVHHKNQVENNQDLQIKSDIHIKEEDADKIMKFHKFKNILHGKSQHNINNHIEKRLIQTAEGSRKQTHRRKLHSQSKSTQFQTNFNNFNNNNNNNFVDLDMQYQKQKEIQQKETAISKQSNINTGFKKISFRDIKDIEQSEFPDCSSNTQNSKRRPLKNQQNLDQNNDRVKQSSQYQSSSLAQTQTQNFNQKYNQNDFLSQNRSQQLQSMQKNMSLKDLLKNGRDNFKYKSKILQFDKSASCNSLQFKMNI